MASAAWERRNAKARGLGYSSYYDYRAHDYGRRPPGEPKASGAELERLRGHRGAADLDRAIARGDVELVNVIQIAPGETEVLVTFADGSTKSYTVKGAGNLQRIRDRIDELGPDGPQIVGSPKSRKMLADEEEPEELDDDELLTDDELQAVMDDSDIPF